MARDLDIIIFGASGFTGKHAIPIVAKLAKANNRNLKWGVAGRSEKKLQDALAQYEKEIGSVSDIPVIIATLEDEDSLNAMAAKTRIVLNCCGPYRFYGEPVVKACVEQGTHQVDVSGEPEYVEGIQLKYNKKAQEKGVYIISTCGFDSIPSDLGVVFLQEKFGGVLNSVVTYLEAWEEDEGAVVGPAINYGTWHSAVFGIGNAQQLRELRRELYPTRLPSFSPKLEPRVLPHKADVVEGWALPFPGADRSVVRRSQRFFYEHEKKRPIQIETYFIIKSFFSVLLLAVFGAIFTILAKFEFGRNLLLKYPEKFSLGIFSRDPPSEEKIEKSWFSITLYGEGWKEKLASADDKYTTPVDKAIVGRIKGRNPGYGSTCVALALAGIVILTEADKLPSGGGVLSPGAAFAKTSLIQQLNENEVTFEILTEKDL